MRETPTSDAPPYITGATSQKWCGHIRSASLVTADAAANAAVVCPEGNDCLSALPKPPPNLKSCAVVSAVAKGRALPVTPFRIQVMLEPKMTASVPCQPRSSISG